MSEVCAFPLNSLAATKGLLSYSKNWMTENAVCVLPWAAA